MKIGNQLKFGLSILVLLLGVTLSCTRSISVPVSPNIPITSVFTGTPTNSPTASATATFANTATNTTTSTPSGTPTNTFTPTNSPTMTPTATVTNTNVGGFTNTFTVTFTTTATPTLTPTATLTSTTTSTTTLTATSTPGNCVLQASYNFSNSTDAQCWGTVGLLTPTVVVDTVNTYNGQDALQTSASFSSQTDQVNIVVSLTTPANLPTGSVVSLYYEVLGGTTGVNNQNGQILVNGTTGSTTGGWQNNLSTTYIQDAITLTGNATGVSQIGFQVLYGGTPNPGGAESVTIDIAAVSITVATGGTPTPLPNDTYTFADNTTDCWYVAYNSAGGDSLAVTNVTGLPAGLWNSNTYGLDLTQVLAAGNDLQAEVLFGPGCIVTTTPFNFVTNGATGIRMQVLACSDVFSNNPSQYAAAGPYIKTSTGAQNYGGCYNGWYQQNAFTVGSPNTWYTVSLQPNTTGAGNWSTDEQNVTGVGIDMNVASGTQATSGDFIVDNVEIY